MSGQKIRPSAFAAPAALPRSITASSDVSTALGATPSQPGSDMTPRTSGSDRIGSSGYSAGRVAPRSRLNGGAAIAAPGNSRASSSTDRATTPRTPGTVPFAGSTSIGSLTSMESVSLDDLADASARSSHVSSSILTSHTSGTAPLPLAMPAIESLAPPTGNASQKLDAALTNLDNAGAQATAHEAVTQFQSRGAGWLGVRAFAGTVVENGANAFINFGLGRSLGAMAVDASAPSLRGPDAKSMPADIAAHTLGGAVASALLSMVGPLVTPFIGTKLFGAQYRKIDPRALVPQTIAPNGHVQPLTTAQANLREAIASEQAKTQTPGALLNAVLGGVSYGSSQAARVAGVESSRWASPPLAHGAEFDVATQMRNMGLSAAVSTLGGVMHAGIIATRVANKTMVLADSKGVNQRMPLFYPTNQSVSLSTAASNLANAAGPTFVGRLAAFAAAESAIETGASTAARMTGALGKSMTQGATFIAGATAYFGISGKVKSYIDKNAPTKPETRPIPATSPGAVLAGDEMV